MKRVCTLPLYNYVCNTCASSLAAGTGGPVSDAEVVDGAVFETAHSMNPTPGELLAARECPRCGGTDTTKTYHGLDLVWYTRGYGYLDKAGTHRDMARFKLRSEDPYAEYRVPGEVDELDRTLKRGDTPKPKHFDIGQH